MAKEQPPTSNPKSELKDRAYRFSVRTIKFIATLPDNHTYWVISGQLLRSATSIGANVIEAKSASSKKDFIRYYDIALKSANETIYWLSLLKDGLDVVDGEVNKLTQETSELCRMIAASLITLKKQSR